MPSERSGEIRGFAGARASGAGVMNLFDRINMPTANEQIAPASVVSKTREESWTSTTLLSSSSSLARVPRLGEGGGGRPKCGE